ncbi:MAG: GNAT family N-acetyltransferase [Candidatus Heimdallarchaeota archaeon]
MAVNLRTITRENYLELIALRVAPDQEKFVASNLFTIAQMQFKEEKVALGIYQNDIPVGLIAYDLDDYDIWRLMIDQGHQRNGYARRAMEMVLEILRSLRKLSEARTSVVPENNAAKSLYESLGFRENGETIGERENGEPQEIVLTVGL